VASVSAHLPRQLDDRGDSPPNGATIGEDMRTRQGLSMFLVKVNSVIAEVAGSIGVADSPQMSVPIFVPIPPQNHS